MTTQRKTDRPLPWKVGELARHIGLSVRTLHHYDQVGLVRPTQRTASGHRLYGRDDLARLQQVLSLRKVGFPLDEIRAVLDGPAGLSTVEIVRMHLLRVREQIQLHQRLAERLEVVAARLGTAGEVPADELIRTIEAITMIEKHYTPEQLAQLQERRSEVGEERIREVEAEWPALMAEVQAEMDAGTDPADPRVQALAKRWMGLVREFTGGDPGIAKSVNRVWQEEPAVGGFDAANMRRLMEYVGRAKPMDS